MVYHGSYCWDEVFTPLTPDKKGLWQKALKSAWGNNTPWKLIKNLLVERAVFPGSSSSHSMFYTMLTRQGFLWRGSSESVPGHSSDQTSLPCLCRCTHIFSRLWWVLAYGKEVRGESQTKHRHQSRLREENGCDEIHPCCKEPEVSLAERNDSVNKKKSRGNFFFFLMFSAVLMAEVRHGKETTDRIQQEPGSL